MPKLIPAFIFTFIFTCVFSVAVIGAVKKMPAKVKADSSQVQVKKFNADSLKQFKADKEFNYDGYDASTGQPSLWTRFWNWVWDLITRGISSIPYSGVIFKYVFLALAVSLLVYIIFKSLDIDPFLLWQRGAKKSDIPYTESLENIHEINFDAEIERAIAQHNYRLAVRLLYLKCLKQLSDVNLIQWQIDKTNSAYVVELADPQQKQTFGLLTRQFEYVWYGNFAIDKDTFGNINQLFQNFKKQLP